MSTEKCFCHLNGYKVKDADARAKIEQFDIALNRFAETTLPAMENRITGVENGLTELASAGGGGTKLYKHFIYVENDNVPIYGFIQIISTNSNPYSINTLGDINSQYEFVSGYVEGKGRIVNFRRDDLFSGFNLYICEYELITRFDFLEDETAVFRDTVTEL